MFASLKKHFQSFVAKASHTAHELGESLSTRIGESLRNRQRAEDLSLDPQTLRKNLGVDGKNARNMYELIFKILNPTEEDLKKGINQVSAITMRRINRGSPDDTIMLTLDSGEMVKIQVQGSNISIAMRSLDNDPKSQISRVLTKSQFVALYTAIQNSAGGNDASMRNLIQYGATSTIPDQVLGMPDTVHADAQKIITDNSPAFQAHRRQERARIGLGLAS